MCTRRIATWKGISRSGARSGTRSVDWKGQIAALLADGYTGWLIARDTLARPRRQTRWRPVRSAAGIFAASRPHSAARAELHRTATVRDCEK